MGAVNKRATSVFCIAIYFVLAIPVVRPAPSKDACDLPRGLQKKIASEFPGATLVRITDLSEGGRRLFKKDHGSECPGAVKVDFYGDGKPTWALVLISGENPKRKAELIVVHQVEDTWEF